MVIKFFKVTVDFSSAGRADTPVLNPGVHHHSNSADAADLPLLRRHLRRRGRTVGAQGVAPGAALFRQLDFPSNASKDFASCDL